MIEREHLIEKQQARVGNAEFVLGVFRQPLNLANRVVSKESDRARGEGRQSRQPCGIVPAERLAQHVKDVAIDLRGPFAFGDVNLPAARHDALVRSNADECVTAYLLAALHRFQQKAFALRPRRAQKCRYRRLQVGRKRAVDGHQRVLFGECDKFLAAGLNEIRRRLHRHQCTRSGMIAEA